MGWSQGGWGVVVCHPCRENELVLLRGGAMVGVLGTTVVTAAGGGGGGK